ncbi:hypothetical protein [Aliidiomarina sp. B3213]|uniref:hypothetical protein n=1 Tax=Aliidiomarina sp. B3213 TaxID=2249757 RepID=UPI000F802BD9|nr:hypothetical protein [Aliidiomarina sp. B3213]RTE87408.1 hypothetical protein DQX04_03205 [Aliidiomarina sp. B3213]
MVKLAVQSQQQVHVEKVAHHAAQSLAVLGARDLNFKAATNRAILANEVFIGQLMALHSWFSMTEDVSVRTALFTSWVPYLNAATRSLAKTVQRMKQPINTGISLTIEAQSAIIKGLEFAQMAFHHASWVSALETVNEVVGQSGEGYQIALLNHQSLTGASELWLNFQQRKQPENYAEWVGHSRDPFTRNRSYNWFDLRWVSVDRAGGSELVSRNNQVYWQSIDTLAVHQRILFSHHEYRYGGGASYNRQRPPRRASRNEFGGTYQINRRTTGRALNRVNRIARARATPYQYLLSEESNEFPQVTVVVTSSVKHELSQQPLLHVGIGRYEVAFSRPQSLFPRRDRNTESPNLFNGLWFERAHPVTTIDRSVIEQQVRAVTL